MQREYFFKKKNNNIYVNDQLVGIKRKYSFVKLTKYFTFLYLFHSVLFSFVKIWMHFVRMYAFITCAWIAWRSVIWSFDTLTICMKQPNACISFSPELSLSFVWFYHWIYSTNKFSYTNISSVRLETIEKIKSVVSHFKWTSFRIFHY